MSEVTTLLKVGSAHLVLEMIEAGVQFRDFTLDNPIRAIREISHDLTGRRTVRLAGAGRPSALDIQREYHTRAVEHVAARGSSRTWIGRSPACWSLWGRTLDAVEAQNLSLIDREIDWAIKHPARRALPRAQRPRPGQRPRRPAGPGLPRHPPRPRPVRPAAAQGLVERVTDDGEIELAKDAPPRPAAKLRGDFIAAAQAAGRDFTVDWVHLKLNDQAQRTVLCKDPFRSVDERVERLIASL